MKKTFQLSVVIACVLLPFTLSAQSQFQVVVPSLEDEVQYVWNTIRDIAFFDQYNYQISLPPGDLIEELKEKARGGNLMETDLAQLRSFMKKDIYRKADYTVAKRTILKQKRLINKMVKTIKAAPKDWAFQSYDQYQVKLTLYGPGGSYNPDEGSLLLFTTPDGKFKQYDNPANTIIHEIVHIGIENAIIQEYQVPHPAKERMVDLIVQLHFQKWLPDYRLQGFGDARVDNYIKKKEDLKELDRLANQFMQENQFQPNN